MKQMQRALTPSGLLLIVMAASGCTTFAEKKLRLDVGMPKDEVVKLLGKPVSSAAQGPVEYLVYPGASDNPDEQYYVRLVNDTVESYGNSTYYSRIRIKSMPNGDDPSKAALELLSKDPGETYASLKKLKGLLDDGTLTRQEFDEQKLRLLGR